MGGIGSGDWERWDKRDTADASLGLDVRYLARRGMLRPGLWSISWSCGGRPSGNIGVVVNDPAPRPAMLTLTYRTRRTGEEAWRDVDQRIWLEWTPCTYGGHRPWLLCPACHGRRAILYSGDGGFYCRGCLRLVYQSQRESAGDRALTRANAIKRRVGGKAGMCEWFPDRPKGMHRRTYERLRREHDAAEYTRHVEFISEMRRWGARLGKRFDLPLDGLLD